MKAASYLSILPAANPIKRVKPEDILDSGLMKSPSLSSLIRRKYQSEHSSKRDAFAGQKTRHASEPKSLRISQQPHFLEWRCE